MSPRHSARHGRQASAGLRLGFVLVLVLGGGAGGVLAAAHYAHPARPQISPTVSDPAMLAASGSSSEADAARGESVSRSSARGASERPAPPTPRPTPTRSHPAPPNTSRPGASGSSGGSAGADPNASVERQVLDLTNQERARAGCGPLTMDARLHAAAQGHSQDMADKDYFAHNDPDGTTPWDRAKAAGYPDPSAENIAIGFPTPADVMDAWMNSPGHKANILNCDSHDLGVGYVVDPNRGAIWTQLFGYG